MDEEAWSTLAEQLPYMKSLPQEFRTHVVRREASRGSLLFRRGDQPKFMFAILAGEAKLVRTTRTGRDVVLQRTRRGLFAEGSLDQPLYHCDGLVTVAATMVAVPRPIFRKALADARFHTAWTAELLRELRRVRAQAERLSLRTAEDRIMHFIETEGHEGRLILTQSRKEWASELGLTHEALYRTLSRLETSKVLRLRWPSIEVLPKRSAPA